MKNINLLKTTKSSEIKELKDIQTLLKGFLPELKELANDPTIAIKAELMVGMLPSLLTESLSELTEIKDHVTRSDIRYIIERSQQSNKANTIENAKNIKNIIRNLSADGYSTLLTGVESVLPSRALNALNTLQKADGFSSNKERAEYVESLSVEELANQIAASNDNYPTQELADAFYNVISQLNDESISQAMVYLQQNLKSSDIGTLVQEGIKIAYSVAEQLVAVNLDDKNSLKTKFNANTVSPAFLNTLKDVLQVIEDTLDKAGLIPNLPMEKLAKTVKIKKPGSTGPNGMG